MDYLRFSSRTVFTPLLFFLFSCLVIVLAPVGRAKGQDSIGNIDLKLAKSHFEQANEIYDRDGGQLWGKSLAGPMIFVDPQTRFAVANVPDKNGQLKEVASLFVGTLPNNVLVANTSMEWSGVEWTMLLWPLPKERGPRGVLLAHEAWHRIQEDVGFSGSGASNQHLDTLEGRYLLQLEWRALATALESSGEARLEAIRDALSFRALRQVTFENASAEESAMELHEGLAEYTGVRLGLGKAERLVHTVRKLGSRPSQMKTFVRSFAYLSGPAYGLLLDDYDSAWIRSLTAKSDLSDLLRKAAKIEIASDLSKYVESRKAAYEGVTLFEKEKARDVARKRTTTKHLAKFVTGPSLEIPTKSIQISFNPNELSPLEGHGTVYLTIKLSGEWGVLEAKGGALISPTWDKIVVSLPEEYDGETETDDWKLELAEGWSVKKKDGRWRIVEVPKLIQN